jgi:hypothetical protein
MLQAAAAATIVPLKQTRKAMKKFLGIPLEFLPRKNRPRKNRRGRISYIFAVKYFSIA